MKLQLPLITQDKANHFIYGAGFGVAALLVLCAWRSFLAQPLVEAWALVAVLLPTAAATVVGIGKEMLDAYNNRRAISQGLPPPDTVETMDAIATALGGVAVSLCMVLGSWVLN